MSDNPEQKILLAPERVLSTQRARTRQWMAATAQREADLLEEVANLEAYIRELQEQVAALKGTVPAPGA